MGRPISIRTVDGVNLSDNLYQDSRKRPGYYRYKRPDGTFKVFQAVTVEQANTMADEANIARAEGYGVSGPERDTLAFVLPEYIKWREYQTEGLKSKKSWYNRKRTFWAMAKDFDDVPLSSIDWPQLIPWWENMTHHMQKQRHAEFRKLFNWLMREGFVRLPYNPFTTNDEKARLTVKGLPSKQRQRLNRDQFWRIYAEANDSLKIAMGISLITGMREGDICDLKFKDNLESGLLKRMISKSEAQRGTAKAKRLEWDLQNHTLLKQLIDKAREMSLANQRCPYVVSYMPKVKKKGKTKTHVAQVAPRRLVEFFAAARDSAGYGNPEEGTPVTFHEIRSLHGKIARDAGYGVSEIKDNLGHDDEAVTLDYLDGHDLPFDSASVTFTEDMIGGVFQ